MALWLQSLGAKVHGYALKPPTEPNLFTVARVKAGMVASTIADIRAIKALAGAIKAAHPAIIIHMAAQPLVRYSYDQPVETYTTNVIGTVNVLECIRQTPSVKAAVIITTDKCYENRELRSGYKETAPLGGYDPYSSSKACAELVTAAYRRSFLGAPGRTIGIATARAGNVIGGGDWAADRLIPDFLWAHERGQALRIRAPKAVRPWQHVLEPLAGYLRLAECLCTDGGAYAEAWNFGPADTDARTVRWIVERLAAATPGAAWKCEQQPQPQPHETHFLKLNSHKARTRLGWQPRWRLETALDKTLAWYAACRQGADMHAVSLAQIAEYNTGDTAL